MSDITIEEIQRLGIPVGLAQNPGDGLQFRFVAGEELFGEDDEGIIYLLGCTKNDWYQLSMDLSREDVFHLIRILRLNPEGTNA